LPAVHPARQSARSCKRRSFLRAGVSFAARENAHRSTGRSELGERRTTGFAPADTSGVTPWPRTMATRS
jgi:hypothetical protein